MSGSSQKIAEGQRGEQTLNGDHTALAGAGLAGAAIAGFGGETGMPLNSETVTRLDITRWPYLDRRHDLVWLIARVFPIPFTAQRLCRNSLGCGGAAKAGTVAPAGGG